jgi:hypothetical protein
MTGWWYTADSTREHRGGGVVVAMEAVWAPVEEV